MKRMEYRIVHGSTHGLSDVVRLIEMLSTLDRHPVAEVRRLFDGLSDIVIARAPGRLDVMGGIADYSGSLVLQLPLSRATLVALQRDPERRLTIVSLRATGATTFTMPLSDFESGATPIGYDAARAYFQREPDHQWAAYCAGAFLVLMREWGVAFPEGARLLIVSDVPEGKGISSSAALEVAAMTAIEAAFDISLPPEETARLCQIVENRVVGAPCGIMDQMTAVCGEAHRLLALLCQPAEVKGHIPIPDGITFWGVDSGICHSVSGADYTSVRIGAFMGYRVIADLAGLTCAVDESGIVRVHDPRWRGYLANITPSEFEEFYAEQVPESLIGADFLRRYGGTTDSATRPSPTTRYAVRTPTAHPIYEHFRVRTFAELLATEVTPTRLELLGELMYQSHVSYGACGLGSEGTDLLVRLVRRAGAVRGLYGAKITGGGSGGTVAVLGRSDARRAIEEVADEYARRTGYQPEIFSQSSPGATAFGHLRLTPIRS